MGFSQRRFFKRNPAICFFQKRILKTDFLTEIKIFNKDFATEIFQKKLYNRFFPIEVA